MYTGLFNAQNKQNAPALAQRDIIEISYKGQETGSAAYGGLTYGRAISFNHILRTGEAEISGVDEVNSTADDAQQIDFNGDDSFGRAIRQVRDQTIEDIAADPNLQKLLQEPHWSYRERQQWEEGIANYASQNLAEIEALGAYRNKNSEGVERAINLNEKLSQDMENGTTNYEFDCEVMSLIEGGVMQQAENHFLPALRENDPLQMMNQKVASSYFYMSARVTQDLNSPSVKSEGHMFIMSPVTGAVVDGTMRSVSSYFVPQEQNFGFEDFVNGKTTSFANAQGVEAIYTNYSQLSLAEYRFSQGIEGVEADNIYDYMLSIMPHDDGFLANEDLWDETRHMAELKQQIVRVDEQMGKMPTGSEALEDLQHTRSYLKEDFEQTLDQRAMDLGVLMTYVSSYNVQLAQTPAVPTVDAAANMDAQDPVAVNQQAQASAPSM
jgi:hypothetical protein